MYDFPPGVDFEFTACDHCGSEEYEIVFSGPDRLLRLPGTFQVVRCAQCGWLRQNPRPTIGSIGFYYPPHYENFAIAVDEEPNWWRRVNRRYGLWKRRKFVERFGVHGRVLDVGCATGNFLAEMARHQWDAYGIEPNEYAADYARRELGLEVHLGTIEDAPFPHNYFDVVTLWDVFEHLHWPWRDLQKLLVLLKPGGLLFLRVPNLNGIEAKIFGRAWIGWDLPRHLYFVPTAALEQALGELGLELITKRTLATAYQFWALNIQLYLRDHRIGAKLPVKFLTNPVVRAAHAPLFHLIGRLGLATTITFVFRKQG